MTTKKNNLVISFLLLFLVILSFCVFIERKHYINEKANNEILSKAINKSFEKFVYYLDKTSEVSLGNLKKLDFPVKNVLIYRFANDMCDECIEQDLKNLYRFQQTFGKSSLLILPAYEENRANKILLSNILGNFSYKNVHDSVIGFPINNQDDCFMRYIAYIGEDKKINSIFFPIKFEQQLTQIYLNSIGNRIKK